MAKKVSGSKSAGTHKTDKSSKTPKISNVHCPKGMTPEEWQMALRHDAATREKIVVSGPDDSGSGFEVRSPKSGMVYDVEFFGRTSKLNRCNCMDFRTNELGTCKHIEAVALAKDGKYDAFPPRKPLHTSVIIDYPAGKVIKLRPGTLSGSKISKLSPEAFDRKGVLTDHDFNPSEFIHNARKIDPDFTWEEDAFDLLLAKRDAARRKKILKEKYADSDFTGLIKTKLHPYQVEGVKFAFEGGRTINADEMGLGKTVQAIATAELLKKENFVRSVIIICPTSLKYQWLSEINRFTDSTAIVVEGDLMKRRDQLNNPDYFYKICSFHAITNNVKSDYIPSADMIIFDEIQRLKNWDTQMGRYLRRLHSEYVMALSGTPLENKLKELYSVAQFVDQFRLGPYYKFTSLTTLQDDTGRVVGYQNLHKVAEMIKDMLIRRRKAEVKLQMPSRTDTNLFVPMTKEQRAIHDEYKFQVATLIAKWRRFKFLSESDRKRLLLFLSMMRMVCDSTFILDQKTRHDTKIDEIKEIVGNLRESTDGGKVVIFSQWERMLRILAKDFENDGVDYCFLHGGVPSVKRKGLIDRFRDDDNCRVFLSTDAGATGLNLQTANLVINVDLPWNPAVLEQRIARIYRLGQKNPVHIINMVARDTIEERMLSTLNFKSNLAAGILDGGEDAIFLEDNKFAKIVDVVDSIIDETPASGTEKERAVAEVDGAEATGDEKKNEDYKSYTINKTYNSDDSSESVAPQLPLELESHEAAEQPTEMPAKMPAEPAASVASERPADQPAAIAETVAKHPATAEAAPEPHRVPDTADEVRDFVAGGMNFLGTLATMLREPEGAKKLSDVLVKEDPATGKASLNIPVPDKATVTNLLSALSTLLNR